MIAPAIKAALPQVPLPARIAGKGKNVSAGNDNVGAFCERPRADHIRPYDSEKSPNRVSF